MKTLFLLLTLFTLYAPCHSQAYRLRATGVAFSEIVPNMDYKSVTMPYWSESSVLCSVDIPNNRLKILNDYNDDFILTSPEKTRHTLKNVNYTYFSYAALDREGTQCNVNIILPDNNNTVYISILYSNCFYVYKLIIVSN